MTNSADAPRDNEGNMLHSNKWWRLAKAEDAIEGSDGLEDVGKRRKDESLKAPKNRTEDKEHEDEGETYEPKFTYGKEKLVQLHDSGNDSRVVPPALLSKVVLPKDHNFYSAMSRSERHFARNQFLCRVSVYLLGYA